MSGNYLENKIREALQLAKGNEARARQQLISWAVSDQALLLALTKPHLNGIAAYAISKIHKQDDTPRRELPAAPKLIDMAPETFGKDLLRALSGRDTVRFGMEGSGRPISRKKAASQQHIDALKAMSAKNRSE